MAPFQLTDDWGSWTSYLVPLLVGLGFGATLEMSGFGDSRKLAAQFYLKDMTVLKVMFTAIIVAGSLIGLGSALGLLDYERIFVNPTFLVPGIVGGLLMGAGFIIGGFCPGTSLVSASTLKIDGIVFFVGVGGGVFLFGETIEHYTGFWYSTAMERFTLQELFGVEMGVVLIGVVLMALFMFAAGEMAEAFFGRKVPSRELRFFPRNPLAYVFAGSLVLIVSVAAVVGQPDAERRWEMIAEQADIQLKSRGVYVHPLEVAELTQDTSLYTRVLDVRSESHFNLFHLRNSRHVSQDRLREAAFIKQLKAAPANTVVFTVSNDETRATEAYKLLVAQGVNNVYIVEGGINRWLTLFPPPVCLGRPGTGEPEDEELAFEFYRAVGDCCTSAYPEIQNKPLPFDCYLAANPDSDAHSGAGALEAPEPEVVFERKVKLQRQSAVKGGCG